MEKPQNPKNDVQSNNPKHLEQKHDAIFFPDKKRKNDGKTWNDNKCWHGINQSCEFLSGKFFNSEVFLFIKNLEIIKFSKKKKAEDVMIYYFLQSTREKLKLNKIWIFFF